MQAVSGSAAQAIPRFSHDAFCVRSLPFIRLKYSRPTYTMYVSVGYIALPSELLSRSDFVASWVAL